MTETTKERLERREKEEAAKAAKRKRFSRTPTKLEARLLAKGDA